MCGNIWPGIHVGTIATFFPFTRFRDDICKTSIKKPVHVCGRVKEPKSADMIISDQSVKLERKSDLKARRFDDVTP